MSVDLSQNKLKDLLEYNPETGLFTWLKDRNWKARRGDPAGSVNNYGYIQIGILGWNYLAHRLAILYMTGELPSIDVDHINRVKADNRFCNLRVVNRSVNISNAGPKKSNKLGARGVFRHQGKYRSRIHVYGKVIDLGMFETIAEASAAYNEAREKHYGVIDVD